MRGKRSSTITVTLGNVQVTIITCPYIISQNTPQIYPSCPQIGQSSWSLTFNALPTRVLRTETAAHFTTIQTPRLQLFHISVVFLSVYIIEKHVPLIFRKLLGTVPVSSATSSNSSGYPVPQVSRL